MNSNHVQQNKPGQRYPKPRQNWPHHTTKTVDEQALQHYNFDEHTDDERVDAAMRRHLLNPFLGCAQSSAPCTKAAPTKPIPTGRRPGNEDYVLGDLTRKQLQQGLQRFTGKARTTGRCGQLRHRERTGLVWLR